MKLIKETILGVMITEMVDVTLGYYSAGKEASFRQNNRRK